MRCMWTSNLPPSLVPAAACRWEASLPGLTQQPRPVEDLTCPSKKGTFLTFFFVVSPSLFFRVPTPFKYAQPSAGVASGDTASQ